MILSVCFLVLRLNLVKERILLELGLAAAFYLLHHLLLGVPVPFEFLAYVGVLFPMFLGLLLVKDELVDLGLELTADVLVDVVVVLTEGLKGV